MNFTTTGFKERLERVQGAMDEAARKSGRSLKDITLVAVTKHASQELILEAQSAGLTLFGESKVQEAEAKILSVNVPGVQWHMIGHLQSNKVKTAVSLFSLIESVDSVRLAKNISDTSLAENKVASILLEINISGELQKYGFKPEELYTAIEEVAELPGVRVLGLMGIAPQSADPEVKREAFKKLRKLFSVCKGLKHGNVEMKHLSMGMSDDFEIAIEEGANMVRLGRALFQ